MNTDRFKYRVAVNNGLGWKIYDVHNILFKDDGTINVQILRELEHDTVIAWVMIDGESTILEQCTGLKDRNGKLIYEGDVVRVNYFDFYDTDYSMFGVIEFGKYGIMVNGVKGEHFSDFTGYDNGEGHVYFQAWLGEFSFDPDNDIEIIGNIHDKEKA